MSAKEVVGRRSEEIRAIYGVVGVSYSGETNRILVYVIDEATIPSIPTDYDGVPTQVIVSGGISTL